MSKRTKFLSLIGIIAALVIGWQIAAYAGPLGLQTKFEDDDGNLADNAPLFNPGNPNADPPVPPSGDVDWNNFAPTDWEGDQPYRTDGPRVAADGWKYFGIEDEQADRPGAGPDSKFKSGTKQLDDCPTLDTGNVPNKDDLQRVYMASKTLTSGTLAGHTILNLAWERITLNSDQSSAHVAFEFNQNDPTPETGETDNRCTPLDTHSTETGQLVKRSTANGGDLLILYDFEGGADIPNISISRWVPTGTNGLTCPKVQGKVLPACWTNPDPLSPTEAEAAVNQGPLNTPANGDNLAPPGPTSSESLGNLEFGEAGVDLTAAGVFTQGQCLSFGNALASSRSSGSSNDSNMFDIAGPGEFELQNCGTIIIKKETVPAGLNQSFSFASTIPASSSCSPDASPIAFNLNDGATPPGDTETCLNVPATSGTPYTVTEDAIGAGIPFVFTSVTCDPSSGDSRGTGDNALRRASITLAAGGTVTCTFKNTQQKGAIDITKTRKHAAAGSGDQPHSGVTFTVNGTTVTTDAAGKACVDGLNFGTYTVHENVPAGYSIDTPPGNDQQVTVDNNATCDTGGPPANATSAGEHVSFKNTPLTDLTVSVNSQVPGGTGSTIDCGPNAIIDATILAAAPPTGTNGDGSGTALNLRPGTYTCTVVIDP